MKAPWTYICNGCIGYSMSKAAFHGDWDAVILLAVAIFCVLASIGYRADA